MRSWSGTFTNELFRGPGTYQAKNGVRGIIDMKTASGSVNILTPEAIEDGSFLVAFDNPDRELVTFNTLDLMENPLTDVVDFVTTFNTRIRRGEATFTCHDSIWYLTNWKLHGMVSTMHFAVLWEGQTSNGVCTLNANYNVASVERTGKGLYTVHLSPGIEMNNTVLLQWQTIVEGLADDNSGEIIYRSFGGLDPTTIDLNTGYRSRTGKFRDDDLVQTSGNYMSLVGQVFN